MDHGSQHWVPSSYLKAWCDPSCPPRHEPYVWRFTKDGSKAQRKAPQNIFEETDFYTIHLPDGQRDLSIEHGLATIEENLRRIREKRINKREPLTREEKAWFCLFVAAMRYRTQAQRNAFQQQWGHALRVAGDLKQAVDAMTPEQRQQHPPPRALGETTGPSLRHKGREATRRSAPSATAGANNRERYAGALSDESRHLHYGGRDRVYYFG
jgi:hypothetical protein